MKISKGILKNFGFYSYAAFIICVVSGIMMALAYDVGSAYDSLSEDFINNRPALFVRSAHYWSANLFMLFAFLHVFDHLLKQSYNETKKGVWLRVCLIIGVVFYVMLSGFLLRGDMESEQARMIFSGLLDSIPLIGGMISSFLLGPDDNLIIIYVHHIATATILIWLSSIEHSKIFQPRYPHYIKILALTLVLAFLFIPYLHNPDNFVTKSPWYFLGLQEALHWLDYPFVVLAMSLIFIAFIYYLRANSGKYSKGLNKIIAGMFMLYIFAGAFAFLFRGSAWEYASPLGDKSGVSWGFRPIAELFYPGPDIDSLEYIPTARGRIESCLICHAEMTGFTNSHDPKAIGCSACHLGDNLAMNKDLAHEGMTLIPGNLNIVNKTCGQAACHPQISENIHNSLMATMSGVIAVDKWAFGEATNPDTICNVMNIGISEGDTHLKNLCVSCHLQGVKNAPDTISGLSRGGGCNACHIDYINQSFADWTKYQSSGKKIFPAVHPQLNIEVTNNRCFGCHSRSGRISTHYEGWLETMLTDIELGDTTKYRTLLDGRIFKYHKPDVHHELGMICTDCHFSYEIMGDGKSYSHKEEQVKIQCADCHSKKYENIKKGSELDYQSARIAEIKSLFAPDKKYIATQKEYYPLINTYIDKFGAAQLILKNGGDTLAMKAPSAQCGIDLAGHGRLSCEACHNEWATSCIGCHNHYDKTAPGWDNLKDKEVKGAWIEEAGIVEAVSPPLGIMKDADGAERIINFIPGMIMTIDKKTPKSHRRFMRLYAPAFAHTIRKETRGCKSCHNNSFAIGYGAGYLTYKIEKGYGEWEYEPEYEACVHDMLPDDAWIEFMKEPAGALSTRTKARPFNLDEQKKILLVATCFTCHKESDGKIINHFRKSQFYWKNLDKRCILPKWVEDL